MVNRNLSFVKIPSYISVFFLKTKKVLLFKYFKETRFLSVSQDFSFFFLKNRIIIIGELSKKAKLVSSINLFLVEVENKIYHKLNITGVGYKVLELDHFDNKILFFRLGFSHFIYFKVTKNILIFCSKSVQIFVKGDSFQKVKRTTALIKSLKKPEPYKGKGISYYNEIKKLKPGKKI